MFFFNLMMFFVVEGHTERKKTEIKGKDAGNMWKGQETGSNQQAVFSDLGGPAAQSSRLIEINEATSSQR